MIALILTAGITAAYPVPMLGKCEVSKLWGTVVPETIPTEQERHLILVQGKTAYWKARPLTVERAVAELGPEMAQGSDMLVIDASAAKCAVVKEMATALEGPAACTPERCFVSSVAVGVRKEPKPAETPTPTP